MGLTGSHGHPSHGPVANGPEPTPATIAREHPARQPYRELAEFADLAIDSDRAAVLLRDDVVGDR